MLTSQLSSKDFNRWKKYGD